MKNLFSSLGHFFATAISRFLTVAPKVVAVADKVETAVQQDAPVVEAVSAEIPVYGPALVPIEKAGEMVLGSLVGVVHALGNAASAKLLDLGLDETAIATITDVYSKLPSAVKFMVKTPPPPATGTPVLPNAPAS